MDTTKNSQNVLNNKQNFLKNTSCFSQFNDDFEDSEAKIRNMITDLDTYIWDKNDIKSKKPLWIAEPNPSSGTFHDSMTLMKRLGSAAKLGCQVFFRQPGVVSLKKPTPDFWTSLLYKNLVGRGVLEAQIVSNNGSGVNIFSHCSPSISQDRSVLDTGLNYEKTAVTVFGVNESPDEVKVNLKASNKDEEVHMYVLTSGKQMDKHEHPEPTLLNGEKLTLTLSGELPVLAPKIIQTDVKNSIISIPPLSIFFLVLPNIKVRSCTSSPLISKVPDGEELIKISKLNDKDLEKSVYETDKNRKAFVKFSKRQAPTNIEPLSKRLDSINEKYRSITRSLLDKLPRRLESKRRRQTNANDDDDVPVKYITYNDNSWLSKLKETMSGIGTLEDKGKEDGKDSKLEKYAPLKSAIVGKESINNEDEKGTLRLKRSSTINPEINKDEEIKKLPKNVFNTLKEVQVTFSNLDNPSNDEQESKRITPRHIIDTNMDKESEELPKEKILTEVTPVIIEDSKESEELSKELSSSEESELVETKALLEEQENEEVSKEKSYEAVNEENNATHEDITVGHIQKIKPNKEELVKPTVSSEMFNSPKEKLINNIMTDIITKENKEEPPLVTKVVEKDNIKESKVKGKKLQDHEIDRLMDTSSEPIIIPEATKDFPNTDSITFGSTSDPLVLEQEIANADKGEIRSKVLRQVPESQLNNEETKDEINGKHVIVERLPGYTSEESETTVQESTPINSTSDSTKLSQSLLKIPLLPKDLKITPESILEEHNERMNVLREKLRETIKDENIWNSIKKREEELRNIFRKFDKRETNFSPYEGTRGIQFVTSLPRNDDSLLTYQIDPIKARPRRRLTQPVKIPKSDYYDTSPYYRSNQYFTPNIQSTQNIQNAELEKPLYELPKSENQYLFPLDSKTQGIVYNNKIYPAKLFGVVDAPNQQQTSDLTYDKIKTEEPYLEKSIKYERYPVDRVQDYVEDAGGYTGDYLAQDQTKKMGRSYLEKDMNEDQQPYIPVVILSQKGKQYIPSTKSHRIRRSILDNVQSSSERAKRSPLFNPSSINDLKYRHKMNSESEQNLNSIDDNANDHNHNSIIITDHSNDEEVCKEIGTSEESIIEQNDKILPQTNNKNIVKRHNATKDDKKKSDNDDDGTTHIFSIITDKFKNLMSYVHRIFNWDKE